MTDRKEYWRNYQRKRYAARKEGMASNWKGGMPAKVSWEEFNARLKEIYREQGLQGQANWRARRRAKVKLMLELGISEFNNPEKWRQYIYARAATQARSRNIDFTIEENSLILPERCIIFNTLLDYPSLHLGLNNDSPSLDRIDNSVGYIPGNVHVISYRANTLKRDANLNELILLGKWAQSLVK